MSTQSQATAIRHLHEVGRAEWRQPAQHPQSRTLAVRQLHFFAGGPQPPHGADRRMSARFAQHTTQFIYLQAELGNPWRTVCWQYRITARLYHPDGSLMGELREQIAVDAACESFWYTGRWGDDQLGQWTSGSYRVELIVDDQLLAAPHFTVAATPTAQLYDLPQLLRLAGLRS
jgi:hypothetical protein